MFVLTRAALPVMFPLYNVQLSKEVADGENPLPGKGCHVHCQLCKVTLPSIFFLIICVNFLWAP